MKLSKGLTVEVIAYVHVGYGQNSDLFPYGCRDLNCSVTRAPSSWELEGKGRVAEMLAVG